MKEGLYFRHIRYLCRGNVTLAIEVKDKWVQFSYALCSPHDHFSKAKGRMIAEHRLRSRKKSRVSGFKISLGVPDDPKTIRDVIRKTECIFFNDVNMNHNWIVPCGWLRRETKKMQKKVALEITVATIKEATEAAIKMTSASEVSDDATREVISGA